ncbi:COP9 signalosome (CSN) subunit [Ascosphaera acerosa]|nr:COP9 signalosome (CSN) subunit [Ascosphaera acerosa]
MLAQTLDPTKPTSQLESIYTFTDQANAAEDIRYALLKDRETGSKLPKNEGTAWTDVYVAYWKASGPLLAARDAGAGARQSGCWTRVFDAWKDVANALIKGYTVGKFPAWTTPCLYVVGKHLRVFAMKADAESQGVQDAVGASYQDDLAVDEGKNARLEETSRIINRMFTLCLQDRSSLDESRKWGVYYIASLSFKTFVKLDSVASCRSLLHAIDATQFDMPPLENFPKSHIVTYKYFVGLLAFLEERYIEAEEHLTDALRLCHRDAMKNKELILNYLIPCHIVTTHTLPSKALLAPFPRLESLFRPLCQCIKRGDLAGFDAAMAAGEDEFVQRKIYLTLERGRDLALRNLFRKVFIAGGFDPPVDGKPPIRRTRVPVAEFAAAMRLGRDDEQSAPERDEVECYLANMIYKGLMKGYISRERGIVVLSKGGMAFPGTGV